MNRREFNFNKAKITGGRGRDDSGLEFWSYSLMSWERADIYRLMKRAAKEAFAEYLKSRNIDDTHWHQHKFMQELGTRSSAAIRDREGKAYRRGARGRKFVHSKEDRDRIAATARLLKIKL